MEIAEFAIARKGLRKARDKTQRSFASVFGKEAIIALVQVKRFGAKQGVFERAHHDPRALDSGCRVQSYFRGAQNSGPTGEDGREDHRKNADGDKDCHEGESTVEA